VTELQISTSPRATWVWAPDEDTARQVREIAGGQPAYRRGELLALVTDVDIGCVALETCEALAAAGFTFTWHESEHPLQRDNWPCALLPGMPRGEPYDPGACNAEAWGGDTPD
jgi:hypothetical protein